MKNKQCERVQIRATKFRISFMLFISNEILCHKILCHKKCSNEILCHDSFRYIVISLKNLR